MEPDEAEELDELLEYPEELPAAIMTTEFIAMSEELTAAETIERLRELEPDAETIYYLYVTDSDGRLVGVLSLRDLIVSQPGAYLRDFMIAEPGHGGRADAPVRGRGPHRPLRPAGRARHRRGWSNWRASSRWMTPSTPSCP